MSISPTSWTQNQALDSTLIIYDDPNTTYDSPTVYYDGYNPILVQPNATQWTQQ